MITKHRTAIVAIVSVLVILVVPLTLAIGLALYADASDNTMALFVVITMSISAHYSPMVVLGICTAIFGPRHVWDVLVTGHRTITTAAVTVSEGYAVFALLMTIHYIYAYVPQCFTNICPVVYYVAPEPLFIFYYYLVIPGICAVVFGPIKRRLCMSMGRTIILTYSAIAIYYVIMLVWIAIDPDVIPPNALSW